MLTRAQWKKSLKMFSKKVFSMYWVEGTLSDANFNDFRKILGEMNSSMNKLFKALKFPWLYKTTHKDVRKEISQLNNQFIIMEYNVNLLSV